MPDEDAPLLTAAGLQQWKSLQDGRRPRPLPEAVILTHQGSLLGRRWPWVTRHWPSFDARTLAADLALVTCRGVGAPAAAVAIEEMAQLGVKRLIAVDLAGSIHEGRRSGDVVLVSAAIGSDGTSHHYSTASPIRPDNGLREALAAALEAAEVPIASGIVWSTDAVYRETPSLILAARSQGATLVDMETAAVLAVCEATGIEAAAVLVVADELFDGWHPPDDSRLLFEGLHRLIAIATSVHRQWPRQ